MKNYGLYILLLIIVVMFSCKGTQKVVSKKLPNNKILNKYAEILKVPETEIKNVKLYSFIDRWYGVDYSYGGLTTEGVDCSGFCNILYHDVYGKNIARSTKELAKGIKKVGRKRLKEGDVVFFNISGKRNTHVGVYLRNNQFVHASTNKGVIISSLENPYYRKSYNKGGRL